MAIANHILKGGLGLVLMIWLGILSDARADFTGVAPPVAGRPMYFDGAIGSRFNVQMRATPTELLAEDSLLLTVSITGTGNLQEIRRPDLRRRPRFNQRFHIDDLGDRYVSSERTRQFDYRLRPRSEAVKEIPPLLFVFFNPKVLSPGKGYQTTMAPAIPITVRPRPEVRLPQVEGATPVSSVPGSFYELTAGRAVLRHDAAFTVPGAPVLAALLLGPPAVGGLWYLFWRRAYPDALRQAWRRRSRAARYALRALQRSHRREAQPRAQQAEAILVGYLRQRHDLPTVEPTPAEVARHLGRTGFSETLTRDVACFFSQCDAARFAPGLLDTQDQWTAKAARLVLALEEEVWDLAAVLTGLWLAAAIAGIPSPPDGELLRRAETAFRAGTAARDHPDKARSLFRDAASLYEELHRRGAANADLYRNLGNSYLLAGDLPRAILSYRRGLRLAPGDRTLRSHLTYARTQVAYAGSAGLGRPAVDNRPPWLPYFSGSQRLWLFLCTYSLGWLGLIRWWMVGRTGPLTTGIAAFGLAMLVASSLVVEEWSKREEARHPLIVLAADHVFLRKGNGALYPPRYEMPLNRGVEARLRLERGAWLQIELAGGQLGWIPRSAALLDMP